MNRFRVFTGLVCAMSAASFAFAQYDNGHDHGEDAAEAAGERIGDPFPLNTCPVSGEEFGSMGDPVVMLHEGREVRFCCEGCIGDFEADPEMYMKYIDEQIIVTQMNYYPTEECIVSGESLFEDGEDIATNVVYGNRLVRLCCKMCKREFADEPAGFLEKLDAAIIAAQSEQYPLDECVVAGDPLGDMDDSINLVLANRLVRLCCEGCELDLEESPARYLAMIDAAWGYATPELPDRPGDHGHDHHEDEEHDHEHEEGAEH